MSLKHVCRSAFRRLAVRSTPGRLKAGLHTAFFLAALCTASAQDTQIQFLSGHDKDDAVPWEFMCTSGANSGFWTNLPVPSQWDVKGFGTLNYKKDLTNAWDEKGLYAHSFTVPADWSSRRIFL